MIKEKLNVKNIFKNNVIFNDKITLYIPSTLDANIKINNDEYIDQALELLSNEFGGASAMDIDGAWMSDSHGLIKENIKSVYAYTSNLNEESLFKILMFINQLKAELNQEAILIEINNDAILI